MSEPVVHVVAAAIIVGDRCLIGQRLEGGAFGGCWEFPGGKLEAGESPHQALRREIREELDVTIEVGSFLERGTAISASRRLFVDVYAATLVEPNSVVRRLEHQELAFIAAEEIEKYLWAPADLPALPALRRLLQCGVPTALPLIVG